MEDKRIRFTELENADLTVDAVYAGGSDKNVTDDPISKLLPVGNSGGIRFKGARTMPKLVALLTSGDNLDWPDRLDAETGFLVYFGDNRREGRELHATARGGNIVLRNMFDASHGGLSNRRRVPPIFVFAKTPFGRDYRFLGLAVPGSISTSYSDDLIAIWRSRNELRYQNYKATFTVLDVPIVSRMWIRDIVKGNAESPHAPNEWLAWRKSGIPTALMATRNIEHRSRLEQEPSNAIDRSTVQTIYSHFSHRPHDFEVFAADLVRMHLPAITSLDVTRRSRDGGRDAIGLYRVGDGGGSIMLDFSLEAKCYKPGSGVGVRELSRLISRLRHRQFGVLVTTSHLDLQAYKELKEDGHPIVVISGREVASILRSAGVPVAGGVLSWLNSSYPDQQTD